MTIEDLTQEIHSIEAELNIDKLSQTQNKLVSASLVTNFEHYRECKKHDQDFLRIYIISLKCTIEQLKKCIKIGH